MRGDNGAAMHLTDIGDGPIAFDSRGAEQAREIRCERRVSIARRALRNTRVRLPRLQVERVKRRETHASESRGKPMREVSRVKQRTAQHDYCCRCCCRCRCR